MTGAGITGRAAPPPQRPEGPEGPADPAGIAEPWAIPTLTTERLTLRAPTLADWPAYAAFYASDRAAILGGPHGTWKAWTLFAADAGHWHLHGFGWWTIDDGAGAAGICGVHHPPNHEDAELGWSLWDRALGRGYATEAAVAARDWWRARHAGRLVSYVDAGNAASQAVARRLGARTDGARAAHDPDSEIWVHPAGEAAS